MTDPQVQRSHRWAAVLTTAAVALATMVVAATPAGARHGSGEDTARYILPPGNYGGLPTNSDSLDQLPLYDGLTPLRGKVSAADINRFYLPENFEPIGKTTEEKTGRKGLTILYDEYGVPHIYGKTREDVAFGSGWTTARDRGLLIQLARGPARVAVADVPGINAFGLVTSGQSFVPSAESEALVTGQAKLLATEYGAKGREILADLQASADGVNAFWKAHNINQPKATVNDLIAVVAFIGSIFGAGGGGEAEQSDLLAKLQAKFGPERGHDTWNDLMLSLDPEAPTTGSRTFDYGPLTGGDVTGSVTLDADSIKSLDPRVAPAGARNAPAAAPGVLVDAAAVPPGRQASNFLVVSPQRSRTGNSVAVMGPQLGYYYPEIVQQVDLHGPGIQAQGAAVPGISMYILIGRTKDYSWSLTSANHDVRDVFVEELCEPDGSKPTRATTNYMFKGKCEPMKQFNAGTLGGTPLRYPTTVHGPIIGTATAGGKPVALSRQRSTFGRDVLNLVALKDMTDGVATTPEKFYDTANQFGFTFNWAYVSRQTTAFFSSGQLPVRAPGLDRRLPTLGTGDYEWQGFLDRDQHPHQESGPGGLLLNWNNRSAPGFMHGDDQAYGSIHRVELFDGYRNRVTLPEDVSIMNRAATEDLRSLVWPVVSDVLRRGKAPSSLDRRVVQILDRWVRADAPRLDADEDGFLDDEGAAIMDEAWRRIADAVMKPVLGDLLPAVDNVRGLGGLAGESYVDKDLRTILHRPVLGRFNVRYCGEGSLKKCQASLWKAIDDTTKALAKAQGSNPAKWRAEASRTGFVPGLIPDTMRTTNRPTFQQVIEFAKQ